MNKLFVIIVFFFVTEFSLLSSDQNEARKDVYWLDTEFEKLVTNGDFLDAEALALDYLKHPLTDLEKGIIYSNLINLCYNLGRFDDVLSYLDRYDKLRLSDDLSSKTLAFSYSNRARIFEKRRSYFQAIEYSEKAIRLYGLTDDQDYKNRGLAVAYHNLGVYHSESGNYRKALEYLKISLQIKQDHGIHDIGITHTSLAKCHAGLKEFDIAEKYFKSSIEKIIEEYGNTYFRLNEFIYSLGEFLMNRGKYTEAEAHFRDGLNRCIKVYGEKNNQTSRGYAFIARNHLLSGNIDSSLYYYQKSIISIVSHFDRIDIASNPRIDSAIFDIRLMENLKGKSAALESLALREDGDAKIRTLNFSLETVELAIELIDRIRNGYPSEEIMMYIAGTEKETYISAIRIASEIYSISKDKSSLERMYGIALRAKAAVLRNQITGNNLLYSSILPESIRVRQIRLSQNVAGYSKMLLNETGKPPEEQNEKLITSLKDDLFAMNKEKEMLTDSISEYFPQYEVLMRKTMAETPGMVQQRLEYDEAVVDYVISNKYIDGKRKLYSFVVKNDEIHVAENDTDSSFASNAFILERTSGLAASVNTEYLQALHYFYNTLIRPLEKMLDVKRIIVVADEEIHKLPFEAFLAKAPAAGKKDFDGLHFLVKDYTISHSYSASLLPEISEPLNNVNVYSFSPSYAESGYDSLGGALREIQNIHTLMDGKLYSRSEATKESFLRSLADSSILHLAMHSVSDTLNSLYSYLLFGGNGANDESSRLYNYEVSTSKINSPMIVLSSCNSGTGDLYSGEGQLSLARSFIVAGGRSVVRTAWDVNDDSGSEIITRFYHYLARGMSKDKALQRAKLDFIENAPPALRDPYYWAAYEIVGDNGPVIRKTRYFVTIVTILLLLCGTSLVVYLRRRRIFSDDSR